MDERIAHVKVACICLCHCSDPDYRSAGFVFIRQEDLIYEPK